MASKVADAGQSTNSMWNAKGVNRVLAQNKERMNLLFEPEEIDKFQDLKDAGNILQKDRVIPEPLSKRITSCRRGAMGAIRAGSTAARSALRSLRSCGW